MITLLVQACLSFLKVGAFSFGGGYAVLAFIQRFVPRVLDGFLLGYIFRLVQKTGGARLGCFVTGFFSAFLNTLFFMTALILLYGNTEYVQGLIGGRNILLFVCSFVGINAVCEMAASTILTGAIGYALYRSRLFASQK